VKHYFYRGFKYLLKSAAIKTRALKSWIAGNGLLVRGIRTPVPLALAERKLGPFIYESFLITEWLPEVRELNDYIKYINQQGLSSADKTNFIQCVAATIRNLHEKGVYHADLKSTNILVREEEPRMWRFYFIDLERVKFKKNLTFRDRANNLAQINASIASCMTARDRLKFFRFYAKGTQLFGERKKYYREVLAISKTKNTEPFGVVFK
jgi:tRNA A-37 threonylcarbamoyl transferase component Bud32